MKLTIDLLDNASITQGVKLLSMLGHTGGVAASAAAATVAAAPNAPAPAATPPAPAPAAPPAPSPAPAPAPAAAPAPAPSPAPAPAPAPPPVAGGISAAQFAAQVQEFAKKYTPKACKARFGELSTAFGQNWTKTSDIPADQYAGVMPWFATA